MSANFNIRQVSPEEVRVELFGHLDARSAELLETDLAAAIGKLPAGSFGIHINTIGMTDCSMDARPVLVKLQKRLAAAARRTVYVDDRARFRGLALWVMHLAEDPNAKAVATIEQARQWLAGTSDRLTDVQHRVEASR